MSKVVKYKTNDGKFYDDSEITLHHYKEPLIKVEDGHGYYGAISGTADGMYIQCHICGELHKNLGNHLKRAHSTTGREYKERFGLAYQSALVSENYRMQQKNRSVMLWHNLSAEEKSMFIKRLNDGRGKRGKNQPNIKLETKNKRGTCPDQLLDKIKEVAKAIGHTPSKREFIAHLGTQRFVHLIYKTFGSWTKAVTLTGMTPKNKNHGKGGCRRYDDNELLQYLVMFTEDTGEVPSQSDFFRGLLPNEGLYTRRWGSLENARQVAGVYDLIPKE